MAEQGREVATGVLQRDWSAARGAQHLNGRLVTHAILPTNKVEKRYHRLVFFLLTGG